MPRQLGGLSRRRFLQLAIAAGAAAGGGVFSRLQVGDRLMASAGPDVRTATWTVERADLSGVPADGTLLSPVWAAPFAFNAIGARS